MFKLQLNDAKKMIRALWFLFHHRSIHTKLVTNPGKKKKRVSLGNGMCKYSKKKRKKISRCLMCRKYSFIFCHFFEVKKKKKVIFNNFESSKGNRQRDHLHWLWDMLRKINGIMRFLWEASRRESSVNTHVTAAFVHCFLHVSTDADVRSEFYNR